MAPHGRRGLFCAALCCAALVTGCWAGLDAPFYFNGRGTKDQAVAMTGQLKAMLTRVSQVPLTVCVQYPSMPHV
jgi:hypothetical protein